VLYLSSKTAKRPTLITERAKPFLLCFEPSEPVAHSASRGGKGGCPVTALAIFVLGLIVVCVVVLLIRKKGPTQGNSDAQVIDRLMKAGSDLTRAHDIEFLFYFPSRASAENISTRLQADGYKVSIEEAIQGQRSILHATRSTVPLLSDLQALRPKLDDLAARESGIFDSWKAEVLR
jgi:hypothetical protein